jgi:hypothetical protein
MLAGLVGLVGLLQGYVEERDAFRRAPGIIHLANGMLHLADDSPVLRPFSASYRSRNAAPVAYDPTADCPRFRHELLESALEPDDARSCARRARLLGRVQRPAACAASWHPNSDARGAIATDGHLPTAPSTLIPRRPQKVLPVRGPKSVTYQMALCRPVAL